MGEQSSGFPRLFLCRSAASFACRAVLPGQLFKICAERSVTSMKQAMMRRR